MIAFFRTAPILALALFSGPIADRLSRRLLIGAQVVNCAVSVGMLLIVWLGLVQYWQIAVATLLMGVSWAVYWPNRRAFLMDVVGADQVHGAVALDTAAGNLSRIVGPLKE